MWIQTIWGAEVKCRWSVTGASHKSHIMSQVVVFACSLSYRSEQLHCSIIMKFSMLSCLACSKELVAWSLLAWVAQYLNDLMFCRWMDNIILTDVAPSVWNETKSKMLFPQDKTARQDQDSEGTKWGVHRRLSGECTEIRGLYCAPHIPRFLASPHGF